jgi:MFS superfamily sulfate permease-like transporter
VHNIVALCGLALVLSGVLQVGFALLGLARLARLAPQPVLAGFMNSAALLVVLSQIPLLLDLPPGARLHLDSLAVAQPAALALGLGTAGCIWLLAWRRPQLPAALLGLVIGTLVHALWSTLGGATSAGATVGPLPSAWPWPPAVLPLLGPGGLALLQSHAVPLATTALALAALGALESSLNVRAIVFSSCTLITNKTPQRQRYVCAVRLARTPLPPLLQAWPACGAPHTVAPTKLACKCSKTCRRRVAWPRLVSLWSKSKTRTQAFV